ncbi:MAG: acyl-CoA desaturase [Bacteroidales bacterium]|nr:acyl-CoA desaturase [Bacteroidales bacterium]MCB9012886.1 acyl-CoA desaturase [Bacteroidales bacterium]
MVLKSISILSLYLIPYFIVILSGISNPFTVFGLWIIMGIGSAGIGLSIMHDANHGSYSKNQNFNKFLGYLLNFIGGSAVNWKLQHNYLHHGYTNVDGMDEDINTGVVLRLSPNQKRLKVHRWQHIYGWFLYGLMTISWVTSKDYAQLKRYRDMGLLKKQNRSYRWLLNELILSKLFFYSYLLVIPLIFSGVAWWQTILFFVIMHFLQGFILTIVFQPAHVMPESSYPLPDENGNLENNWAIHQMLTTNNFSPKSRIFSWYVGGLNYQIEHHLFPNICHIHYKKISGLVRDTAKEYGIPYNVQKNFILALINHGKMLKMLGTRDTPA